MKYDMYINKRLGKFLDHASSFLIGAGAVLCGLMILIWLFKDHTWFAVGLSMLALGIGLKWWIYDNTVIRIRG